MRHIYTFVIYLLAPFVLLRLFWLGTKNSAYRLRWRERFGSIEWRKTDKPVIWIHAVSVGEVNAASPIVNRLLEQYPDHLLLMTTVTPTGAITIEKHFGEDVRHLYLPYDLPFAVNKFLNIVQPTVMITMETEIWPNLYYACNQLDIPVLIINARLSQQSAKRYRLVSNLMRDTLSLVKFIAAQTRQDAERFIAFGATREKVFVTGNLKFDITVPHSITEQAQSLKRYFSVNRPIWIAASTHEGEEKIVLNAHINIMKQHPDAILIIAPRHPERIDKIAAYCKSKSLNYVKRTKQKVFTEQHHVYLLDTLGELQLHYAASQVAFVGGSLVETGGQNMMEPASLGLPVISGPHTFNFTEITELLLEQNVLISISNESELTNEVSSLLNDANRRHYIGEIGRKVIESNRGNIDRLMQLIEPCLSQ